MTKELIIQKLQGNHRQFAELLLSLNEHGFQLSPNNKWSAGQQLNHIQLSVAPFKQALSLPLFILKLIFGKANRPSKTYDELVAKYRDKLSKGGVAPGRFIPKLVAFDNRERVVNKLTATVEGLCRRVKTYNESELDGYILPHPLLGKVTLREMLYFTIYHVTHHERLIRQGLGRT